MRLINIKKSNNLHMSKGGKREGAGRKPKYGEATITVAFRIPESTREEVTKAVKRIINKKKPQP